MSIIGHGTALAINDGTASAFQDVPDLVNVTPPDDEVGNTESKRLNLAGGTLTKVPTLKNPGEFTFTYEFDPAVKTRIDALKGAIKSFKITPNGGTAKTVPGFVSKNAHDQIEADAIQTVTATVIVTGPAS